MDPRHLLTRMIQRCWTRRCLCPSSAASLNKKTSIEVEVTLRERCNMLALQIFDFSVVTWSLKEKTPIFWTSWNFCRWKDINVVFGGANSACQGEHYWGGSDQQLSCRWDTQNTSKSDCAEKTTIRFFQRSLSVFLLHLGDKARVAEGCEACNIALMFDERFLKSLGTHKLPLPKERHFWVDDFRLLPPFGGF